MSILLRIVGSVCAAGLVLSGCSDESASSPSPGVSKSPSSTWSRSSTPDLASAVRLVALTREDLPAEFGPDQMQQGDEVDGQVTLDLCGGDFPSEALRVARHQVAFPIGDDFDRAVSNEVVAYERDGADQAMRELRRAVDRCPDRFVGSAVATKPVARYHIKQLPPHGSWQTGSLALHIRVEARAGDSPSYEYIAVYQVRGQLLSALYLSGRRAEAQLDDLSALVSHRLDDIVVSSSA